MKGSNQITSENLTFYRAVAMTMVVLYHCTCYYAHPTWPFGEGPYNPVLKIITTLMGGIHMPVFVFISGYLYWMLKAKGHYDNLLLFYKNKILRLLVPYLVMGGAMLIIFNQFYNLNSALYGICHLWFLLMLFGLFILAPVVCFFMERIKNDRIATVAVNASFLLYPIFCDINLLQITKVFYFLPFFLIGYIIQRRGRKVLYRDCVFWLSIVSVMIILFVVCQRTLFIDKIIREFASYFVIIIVSIIPNFSIPNKYKKIINNFSDNSMGIYLVHHVIISYIVMIPSVKLFIDNINSYIGAILLFGSAFLSSWLLSILLNKYNFTRFLVGSKIKK